MNNYWEELDMPSEVNDYHKKVLKEEINLPNWSKIICPNCEMPLGKEDVRGIGFLTNSRNLGDIAVTVTCKSCVQENTVYFNEKLSSLEEFISVLLGNKGLTTQAVEEQDMYSLNYNNLVEKMFIAKQANSGSSGENNMPMVKRGSHDTTGESVEISSNVYICNNGQCDHTEIATDVTENTVKKCPRCSSIMELI